VDVRDTRVLVTGATGSLGAKVVQAFLALGAEVVGTARRKTGLDELRAAVGHSDRFEAAECDVTDPAGIEALFSAVERRAPLSAVVHLVGGYAGGPLWEADDAAIDRLVSANLRSAVLVLRAALRRMVPRRAGSIVVVAGDAALAPSPGAALYGATKAAVVHLVQSAALEVRESGIRVNALLPGVVDTPDNREAMPEVDPARWVPPLAVARAAVWLAGSSGDGVSGALVRLPGG